MLKKKNSKLPGIALIGGTLALMLAGTTMAGAAINNGHFAMKATDTGDSKITAISGNATREANPGGGGGEEEPEVPVEPEIGATFQFTINTAAAGCTAPGIHLDGLAADAKLIAPDGTEKAPAKGFNTTPASGQWTLDGTFNKLGSTSATAGQMNCLISVDKWGKTETKDISGAFQRTANLQSVATPPSTITNIESVFRYSGFNGDVSGWDTANVDRMNNAFADTAKFNNGSAPGASDKPLTWDTSKIFRASGVFSKAAVFNQPLNSWDTSKFTATDYMFRDAKLFNQPLDKWNMARVGSTPDMFNGATAFNQNIDGWTMSAVTNTQAMFKNAKAFNQPLNSWDMSKNWVTAEMFSGASNFNQPLGNWDMAQVTNANQMFMSATSFNQPVGKGAMPVARELNGVFQGATSFNQPVNHWAIKNPEWAIGTFLGASSFNQPLDKWSLTGSFGTNMFLQGATSFEQDLSSWRLNYTGDEGNSASSIEAFASGASKFAGNCALWPTISGNGASVTPCK